MIKIFSIRFITNSENKRAFITTRNNSLYINPFVMRGENIIEPYNFIIVDGSVLSIQISYCKNDITPIQCEIIWCPIDEKKEESKISIHQFNEYEGRFTIHENKKLIFYSSLPLDKDKFEILKYFHFGYKDAEIYSLNTYPEDNITYFFKSPYQVVLTFKMNEEDYDYINFINYKDEENLIYIKIIYILLS